MMQLKKVDIDTSGLQATHVGNPQSPYIFIGLGSLVHRGIGSWGEAPETIVEYGCEFVSIDWPYESFSQESEVHIAQYIAGISRGRELVFTTLSFGDVLARSLVRGYPEFFHSRSIRIISIMGVTDFCNLSAPVRLLVRVLSSLPRSALLMNMLAQIAYILRIGVNPFHQNLSQEEIDNHRHAVQMGITLGLIDRSIYMKKYGGYSLVGHEQILSAHALWSPLDLIFHTPKENAHRSNILWGAIDAHVCELPDGAHAAIVERPHIFEKELSNILESSYGLQQKHSIEDGVWSGE